MPWCPKCKTEYRDGIEKCSDCGSVLVESLKESSDTVDKSKMLNFLYGPKEHVDTLCKVLQKEGRMKAIVSITLDNEFVVHDIKVIEGEKGLFIAMPSKKAADGEYRDIAHPINSETRDLIQTMILESYEKALEIPDETE